MKLMVVFFAVMALAGSLKAEPRKLGCNFKTSDGESIFIQAEFDSDPASKDAEVRYYKSPGVCDSDGCRAYFFQKSTLPNSIRLVFDASRENLTFVRSININRTDLTASQETISSEQRDSKMKSISRGSCELLKIEVKTQI